MIKYNYPIRALIADYLRSAFGIAVPLFLICFASLAPAVFYIMAALLILFAFYGIRTAWRHGTVFKVDKNGIRQEGPILGVLDCEISWAEMENFYLRYYSTRRDRQDGWMQLAIRGVKKQITGFRANFSFFGKKRVKIINIDSNLPGFEDIVKLAHAAMEKHGLSIDATTATNLSSLAIGLGNDNSVVANVKSQQ